MDLDYEQEVTAAGSGKRYEGREAARRFVELLDGDLSETEACWRTFPDRERGSGNNYNGAFEDVLPALEKDEKHGRGVFRVINLGGHKNADITTVVAFFVDGDDTPLPEEWHLPPSFICERGSRWHAYWLAVFDTDADRQTFRRIQKRLAKRYGGDPVVCNLSRVMRIPGFAHHKNGPGGRGYTLTDYEDASRRYTVPDIEKGLPELDGPVGRVRGPIGGEYDGEPDQPDHMRRAFKWLRQREPAIAKSHGGGGGDNHTYQTSCFLAEFALSADGIVEVMNRPDPMHGGKSWNDRCQPEWDFEELETKAENAIEYGENPWGCRISGAKAEVQRVGGGTDTEDNENSPLTKCSIFLSSSKLIGNLEELNDAVVTENLDLFERGGSVVSLNRLTETEVKDGIRRPVGSYVIGPVNPHVMQYHAMRAATFWKWNERAKDYVETECPKKLIDGYLANHHVRSLRPLHGIAQAPTLRPDGSVLQDNGYDAESAMFVTLRGDFPKVSENPTREDAQRALTMLRHVVRGIMFDGRTGISDRTPTDAESVWLAAALTSVIRGAIPTAPMFGFSAPTKGSGKTLAADLVGIIATGNDVPAMSIPDSEEEIRKTLFASLLAGDEVVLLDNVKAGVPLRSDALNAILTKSSYEGRVLGASTILTVPVVTTFLASGNNFSVDEDLRRRTLVCYIDPRVENPDQRRYDWDARIETRERRSELVAAVLTIIRAFLAAKETDDPATELELVPYGSFEDWDRLVRYPLVWLGMPDPANTRKLVLTGSDTERQEQAFVTAWAAMFNDTWVRVRDAVVAATRHYDDEADREKATALREILEDISDDPRNGIANKKIGEWMTSRCNRVIGGKRFEKENGKVQKWRLTSLNP